MLIANSNLVGRWATWEHVPRARRGRADDVRPDDRGVVDLHRHARASSRAPTRRSRRSRASASAARCAGRLVVTAGLGGMGGAQPLAVTMNEGCALCVEVDLQRIERRHPRALPRRARRVARRRARAAGGGAARGPRALDRAARQRRRGPAGARRAAASTVDVVTDQTSAHDPLNGYVPAGPDARAGRRAARRATRTTTSRASAQSRARARRRDPRRSARRAPRRSTTATRCAALAEEHGDADAFAYPGFVPAYIRPLFCEGKGPFRWVALSGDPADIAATDRGDPRPVRRPGAHPRAGSSWPSERVAFQGLPARICWLGYGERHLRRAALQRAGRLAARCKAPIVIGRDHLDAGSVASPQRETESMRDGSDAVADWPILNALVNTATGAVVGLVPPRRRRRHGAVAARRPGHASPTAPSSRPSGSGAR